MYTIVEIDQPQADEATTTYPQQPQKSGAELFRHIDVAILRRRNAKVRQLLKMWLEDKSGYEDETWASLKRGLDKNRSVGQRKLYNRPYYDLLSTSGDVLKVTRDKS